MTILAIDWASVGIKAGQLILSLSILVVLHELGHFLPAKWFKCRVEKFYLFFDPWFSLFKKKIKDTEYGIGWLPLGGYVKIAGMIDESMDKEQLKKPAQPWEFRSKPAWQRLIIMSGGVIVNLILGFLLFSMILFVWGERTLPADKMQYGIATNAISEKAGLKDGDKILSFDGVPVVDFFDINRNLILNEVKNIEVERNGQQVTLPVPAGTVKSLIKTKSSFVEPRAIPVVDSVFDKFDRFTQGKLAKGDKILALNNHPIQFYDEYFDLKFEYPSQEITLDVLRGTDTIQLKANTDSLGNIGFYVDVYTLAGAYSQKSGFFESIPNGISKGWETLIMNIQNFKLLFTSEEIEAKESLGSFLSIGNMFGAEWNWERFWNMTALLSIILAFMNFLPIPALDGGHVLFTLYEMITGRKPGDKFMEYAQVAGMIILLGLMAYAIGLDFWRFFR